MVSRPLILSLLLAASVSNHGIAADSLRASVQDHGESSQDIPDLIDTRRSLQEDNTTSTNATTILDNSNSTNSTNSTNTTAFDANTTTTTTTPTPPSIIISDKCLALLTATANDNGLIKKESYFVFSDGMSNGYYTFNNMTSYSDLPMTNKFGFVTLSCQCVAFGGRGNCCQGNRAALDVGGIGDPENMTEQLTLYVGDICKTTQEAIGEDTMPPTGELPITLRPTSSSSPSSSAMPSEAPSATGWPTDSPSAYPSESANPSESPTDSPIITPQEIVEQPGLGNGRDGTNDDKLSGGAWVGIAIAGAAVLTLMLYLLTGRKKDDNDDDRDVVAADDDLEQIEAQGTRKELLAITNGELALDAPPRLASPDATNSMTASDVSSIPSVSTSGRGRNSNAEKSAYFANNSLLPGHPDEESMLSSNSEGPSFFTDDDTTTSEGFEMPMSGGLGARDSLNTTDISGESLDQAIESGNWEAVAASAARIVKNNEPVRSMLFTDTSREV